MMFVMIPRAAVSIQRINEVLDTKVTINGGTYTNSEYAFNVHDNCKTTTTIILHEGVTYYNFLKNGTTDVTASDIITIDKAITLDGNGKTLTSTAVSLAGSIEAIIRRETANIAMALAIFNRVFVIK